MEFLDFQGPRLYVSPLNEGCDNLTLVIINTHDSLMRNPTAVVPAHMTGESRGLAAYQTVC